MSVFLLGGGRDLARCGDLPGKGRLGLTFEWDPTKAALVGVETSRVAYRWQGLDYVAGVEGGSATATATGWKVDAAKGSVRLKLAQTV